jgi:hypothetical protein
MAGWRFSSRKSSAPCRRWITGRFEIERVVQVAYLEYTMTGSVLGLIHTEVPAELRGLVWRLCGDRAPSTRSH